jgi:hypothetical protein
MRVGAHSQDVTAGIKVGETEIRLVSRTLRRGARPSEPCQKPGLMGARLDDVLRLF